MIMYFNTTLSILKFTSILFLLCFLFSFVFFLIFLLLDRLGFQKHFKKYLNLENFQFIQFLLWDNLNLIKIAFDLLLMLIFVDLFVIVLEFNLQGTVCYFPHSLVLQFNQNNI